MHFLKDPYSRPLGQVRAFVHVEYKKKNTLTKPDTVEHKGQVVPNLFTAKADVMWANLPDTIRVVNENGELIKPSAGRQFYVTTETVNPFHGLMEAEPEMFRGR